jgi:hypothetical protein
VDSDRSKRALSMEERMELRKDLLGHRAKKALEFQTKAVRLFGPPAGIMARQILFWDTRGHDPEGWIYKSRSEIEIETGLTRRQQEKARKVLRGRGVVEEDLRPVGPMRRRSTQQTSLLRDNEPANTRVAARLLHEFWDPCHG